MELYTISRLIPQKPEYEFKNYAKKDI